MVEKDEHSEVSGDRKPPSMPPTNQSLEDRVRRKVRRVFYQRTHRGSKIDVRVEKEMQKYKTIIAPYEPTVEQLTQAILSIIRELANEVIGYDDWWEDGLPKLNKLIDERNKLRAEQRTKLKELLNE